MVSRLSCLILLSVCLFSLLAACEKERVKEGVYHGLHDRQFVVDKNEPHCDPDRMSYDDYKKEREKIKKE